MELFYIILSRQGFSFCSIEVIKRNETSLVHHITGRPKITAYHMPGMRLVTYVHKRNVDKFHCGHYMLRWTL